MEEKSYTGSFHNDILAKHHGLDFFPQSYNPSIEGVTRLAP